MSMRRSVDVLYPFYINQVRNFLISIGNSFVSSRGVLSLRGGVFKIKMNLELSAKMMCVLF